jgi:hypothetical protein
METNERRANAGDIDKKEREREVAAKNSRAGSKAEMASGTESRLTELSSEKSETIMLIEELEANGFVTRFRTKDDKLQCIDTGKFYEPEDLQIVGIHRYEGTKDLGDQSVIYAISDGQGMRGVIIDSYGAYADADLGDCIRRIPVVKDKGHSAESPLIEEIE